MTQAAKAQEPSMEEILASIRRIIADDDAAKAPEPAPKPAPKAVEAPLKPAAPPRVVPPPPPPAPPPAATNNQDDIDAMLAGLDAEAASEPDPAPEPEPDILDLTESMAMPAAPAEPPQFRTIDGQSDLVFTEPPQRKPESAPAGHERQLMSETTRSMVDSAFNTLAHTVLVQNSRTLEDLVREMLRPMLKSWLDDNLPGLVERLVRVSRGRQ
jgi:hypothetical protein